MTGAADVVPEVVRPARYPAKHFFVVVAVADSVAAELAKLRRPASGVVFGSYCEADGYVIVPGRRGTLAPESIFCGFHSHERSHVEAEAYWAAAQPVARDLLRLPRRRFR